MSEQKLHLNIGDSFYNIDDLRKYTVVHEDKSAYYLAIFDGSCSKIKYTSKNAAVTSKEFNLTWFKYREEMLQQRIKNAERHLYLEKNSLTRHLERRTST
jgi:hypothetical protein